MNGIILYGPQATGKTMLVRSIGANVKYIELSETNSKYNDELEMIDVLPYYYYDLISIKGLGDLRKLPKVVPENYWMREPFAPKPIMHKKPLIIAETNLLDLKQEDFRHWKLIQINKSFHFMENIKMTHKEIELFVLQYLGKDSKITVKIST